MPGPAAAIASGKTRLNLSAEMQNRFVSRLLLLALSMGMASLKADSLSELWKILPGDRPYVGTGNNERGLAYNPVSKKLLLVGRQGGPQVYVLDAASGADGVEDPSLGVPRVLLQTDAEGTLRSRPLPKPMPQHRPNRIGKSSGQKKRRRSPERRLSWLRKAAKTTSGAGRDACSSRTS